MAKTRPEKRLPQRVRIIAGMWRGRYLKVPPCPEVRPTPSRIKETVFNWLASEIEDATCVDLYAGSGALGFEAASRGAQRVTLVDQDRQVAQCLKHSVQSFNAMQIEVLCTNALDYIDQHSGRIDVVFIDPPFSDGNQLLEQTCSRLAASNMLKESSLAYVESPANWGLKVPETWTILKSKTAGQVGYHLFAAAPLDRP